MNSIIIKGRLTKEPEIKRTYSDKVYCLFSVAVNRKYAKDTTDFFNCTAWEKTGEFIEKYFEKGQEILVDGRMESFKYEKDDKKFTGWGVVVDNAYFCGSKGNHSTSGEVDIGDELPADLSEFQLIGGGDDLPF